MTDFFSLPTITPQISDQLILVRDRKGNASTLEAVKAILGGDSQESDSVIAYSQTPPTDKKLWWQLDGDGCPIDLWRKRTGGLWVSDQVYLITAFDTQVKNTVSNYCANPLPDEALWIESISAKGYVWEWKDGNSYDAEFSIYLINKEHRMARWHYLRLSANAKDQLFNISEAIERLVTIDDALSFMLRTGLQGKTKLKSTAVTVQVRRVYAES